MDDQQFLTAMEQHKQVDPAMAAVLAAIKATVKGGLGKLWERPQGKSYKGVCTVNGGSSKRSTT
ncbi:hypothetical protein [Streptomyces sp. NBC_01614]|uniref:Uncharacterized protein n=1 Tax=Streptomyces sp. NBC_00180 TaxID=2903632 RepID=A0AAU1I9J0_9ACTN